MKIVEVENNRYELIDNYKDGFDMNEFISHYTDFFSDYDYIVGDWAYGKLRLKGFTKKDNKLNNPINDYDRIDSYIENNCAYGCKYFILEKIN